VKPDFIFIIVDNRLTSVHQTAVTQFRRCLMSTSLWEKSVYDECFTRKWNIADTKYKWKFC